MVGVLLRRLRGLPRTQGTLLALQMVRVLPPTLLQATMIMMMMMMIWTSLLAVMILHWISHLL